MFYKLSVNVPVVEIGVSAMSFDPRAPERDHAATMASEGADIVRDANKPSTSLHRASALDHLLSTPSQLDELLAENCTD
jgi:hypothetical protein